MGSAGLYYSGSTRYDTSTVFCVHAIGRQLGDGYVAITIDVTMSDNQWSISSQIYLSKCFGGNGKLSGCTSVSSGGASFCFPGMLITHYLTLFFIY